MVGGPNKNMPWGRLGVLAAWLVCVAGASAVAGQLATIDADAHYPEGPLWRAGRLFYVEYSASNIKTWDGRHTAVYWHKDGCGASALIAFGDHLLVACYDDNSLVELDASGNEVRTVRNDSGGKPFVGPNDFASDGHGGVYVSASGVYDIKAPITGAVLHMSADGKTITEVADTIHYSNGLTLDKGQRHLLVAEMLAGRVLSFPIGAAARRAASWAGFRTAAKDDRAWARGGHPGTRRHAVPVSQRLLPCQPPIDHLIRTTRANAIAARGCAEFSIVRPVTTIASSAFS